MNKEVIESILLANSYFTFCKIKSNNTNCEKTNLARKYLTSKIDKALMDLRKPKSKRNFLLNFVFN